MTPFHDNFRIADHPGVHPVCGHKRVSQDECPMPAQILARLARWPQAGS
jgi:hypothetical protein